MYQAAQVCKWWISQRGMLVINLVVRVRKSRYCVLLCELHKGIHAWLREVQRQLQENHALKYSCDWVSRSGRMHTEFLHRKMLFATWLTWSVPSISNAMQSRSTNEFKDLHPTNPITLSNCSSIISSKNCRVYEYESQRHFTKV